MLNVGVNLADKMKILLTGGYGFIGKRFIKKYSDDYNIIVYARKNDAHISKDSSQLKDIFFEEGSIEDKKIFDVISKHKPDAVVHLAALTGLKKCHDNPDEAYRVNVIGTQNILEACSQTKPKFIFISSREVYGETKNQKSREDDSLSPNNVYGTTKLEGEKLVQLMSDKHNFDFTILRLTNVFGPEGDQYGAQIIIKDALIKNNVNILGGSQRLNYVYIDDVVDLINLVLNDKRSFRQVFNVGSSNSVTLDEYVDEVIGLINKKVEKKYFPMRETETSNFEPDLTKLNNELNYSVGTSLREGITKTIKWYSSEINKTSNQ